MVVEESAAGAGGSGESSTPATGNAQTGEDLVEIHIKAASDTKFTVNIAMDKTVGDLKQMISEHPKYADKKMPPDSQRLIFSG